MFSTKLKTSIVVFIFFHLCGCTTVWQDFSSHTARKGASSSLVDYLYPDGHIPPKYNDIVTELKLPLRVGLAFVPSGGYSGSSGLTEAHKATLLESTKAQFRDKAYVKDITVIPETYLKSSKGFDGIGQISRLFSLDVVALVSYDQVVYSSDTKASFLYWTIVGAYAVEGSKNDVQSFVDIAVFDVQTKKLLLRAPGIDKIEASSTLIESTDTLRKNRETGFSNAMQHLIVNLDKELDRFPKRIKDDESINVSSKPGYGGASFGVIAIITLGFLALYQHLNRSFYSIIKPKKHFKREKQK